MPIRNVLICTTQVPFTTGGAESHVEGLRRALVGAGYNAEVAALPFKWYPPSEIVRGALAWRMLDVTEANGKPIDLVVGMRFPAYAVAHPRRHPPSPSDASAFNSSSPSARPADAARLRTRRLRK